MKDIDIVRALALAVGLAAFGCNDDAADGGGGGSGGHAADGGASTGGSEPVGCKDIEISDLSYLGGDGSSQVWVSENISPELGQSDSVDLFWLLTKGDETGLVQLPTVTNVDDCVNNDCVLLQMDAGTDPPAKDFVASYGRIDFGGTHTSSPYIGGYLRDVLLQEIRYTDGGKFEYVEGGACFIVNQEFDVAQPTPGWTCLPSDYVEDYCMCECGAACPDPSAPVLGCAEGQTCDSGHCADL